MPEGPLPAAMGAFAFDLESFVKVGLIGLGKMGAVMAQRIMNAGHELIVFNRTPEKAEVLARKGARVADGIRSLCAESGTVITMLSDDTALAAILGGHDGLLSSLPAGGIHLAMGTHSAGYVIEAAELHASAGSVLINAPMLGRPEAVAAGTASMIVGGQLDKVEHVRQVLSSIAARVIEAGPDPAAAATMKIANNFVLGCAIEALGEAFSLVRKWGGAPDVFEQVITSGMFSCPAYIAYSGLIAGGQFDQPGFTAALGLKDANLAIAAGGLRGVPLPSGNVWRDRLISAVARGHSHHDWATMALEQARASGLVPDDNLN
jgi:3-hydroxyisobutyrate dehydrogenase-like beta-hydroxyacid dehydrogenase